jgi:hypothetical protein
LVSLPVSLAEEAGRWYDGEGHPFVVSLHLDRKWLCSIAHAVLSSFSDRMTRKRTAVSSHVVQQVELFHTGEVAGWCRETQQADQAQDTPMILGSGLVHLGQVCQGSRQRFRFGARKLATQVVELTKEPSPHLLP